MRKKLEPISKDMQDTLRAGVIQNFEVAYEQSWKMLQRWIKTTFLPKRPSIRATFETRGTE